MTVLATLITSLRTLANDTDASNFISSERLTGNADGSNLNFRLQFRNIVGTSSSAHSVYLSFGSTFRSQAFFTVDLANGLVQFTAGHAPGSGVEVNADYNYHLFSDADQTEFLNRAANHLEANTDPTSVAAGLEMALLQYALGYYWQRRASEYASRYSSSSMGVSVQVDVVTKNFTNLAKAAFELGDKFREMFYERQGQRSAPASGTQSYGIDPYTPMR